MLSHFNSKLVDFGRCECMKLGTTQTKIIAIDSQFIIFHVCDTLIYKVSDKLRDFKSGELSDISDIRMELRSFFEIILYMMMFTMMNIATFFAVRTPRISLFQCVNGGSSQSISYSSPLLKSLNLSETL